MSLDVSQIVAQFGAFYKGGGDNAKTLRNMLYKQQETAAFFTRMPTDDTIYRGTLASMGRIVQPFQKGFTPIGPLVFKPNEFPLYQIKIDKEEYPDDISKTYMGFMDNIPEPDRSKWPLVRYMLEQHIIPKKDEDLEENEYGLGVYAAPTPGTAGAAGTSMNGLAKVIYDYAQGSRINLGKGALALGAIPESAADFCTYVEDFVKGIDRKIRRKIDFIFMDHDLVAKYRQGKREKYNKNYLAESDLATVTDYGYISVQGLESHAGMNLIWASIPANRINPIKKAGAEKTFLVQQFSPRAVSIYADWWTALNFEVPEFIVCNDQFPASITS